MGSPQQSFPKRERLCSKRDISRLLSEGRWGSCGPVKYKFLSNGDTSLPNRIMVSVPKRFFKRAVKRNLLKRRIREAYRLSKHLLSPCGTDIMFLYSSKEVLPFNEILPAIQASLSAMEEITKKSR